MTALPKASGKVHMHRAYTPRYIRPVDLARLTGDREAAYDPEGELVWQQLREHCAKHPLPRAPRHDRIGDPIEDIRARLNRTCPRWLDTAAKAFIIAAGIVSVAIWVAF